MTAFDREKVVESVMRNFLLASLAVLFVVAGGQASAQEWPTHTLTMINPFAAGGPNDVSARLFA